MAAKFHYVYRISNVLKNKHYYGKRSSTIEPRLDLGVEYFSSSKDKEFKEDQQTNPQNYRYKVVQIFPTVMAALIREAELHSKFDVAKNVNFYNKAKQTSLGFDTTGTVRPIELNLAHSAKIKGRKYTEEHRRKIAIANSKPLSLERRLKIGIAHKGKTYSEERKLAHSAKLSGINSKSFSGYYVTPLFVTAIRKKLAEFGFNGNYYKDPDKLISKVSYSKSKYISSTYSWEYINGKTFKDIGFGFIPKEEYRGGCTD